MRTGFEGIVLLHVKARLPGAVHASARRGLSASQSRILPGDWFGQCQSVGPRPLGFGTVGSCGQF